MPDTLANADITEALKLMAKQDLFSGLNIIGIVNLRWPHTAITDTEMPTPSNSDYIDAR